MKRKTFTAYITPLSPHPYTGPETLKGGNREDDPITFAQNIFSSLPDRRYLISVSDSQQMWRCDTQLALTWREGVPTTPLR
jgi:hypothetical protein